MEWRKELIQMRATAQEKKRFEEKGGVEAFRKWLNGTDVDLEVKHDPDCPCLLCMKARLNP